MVTSDLLTITGLAVVTGIIVEVIKRAWQPTTEALSRFGPLLSLVVAVVIGIPTALYTGNDLVQALLTALLAGATASGLYDAVTSQK